MKDNGLSLEDVYALCNSNNWFTNGDTEQYNKMFDMVRANAPINDIAVAIWICSCDVTMNEVRKKLEIKAKELNEAVKQAQLFDTDEIIKNLTQELDDAYRRSVLRLQ